MTIVIIFITHLKKIKSMVDINTSLDTNNEKDINNLDVQKILSQPYKYGFTTKVEVE